MTQPRWRAPREDGALLVAPAWEELPGLVERNQQLIKRSPLRFGGRSLAEWHHASADTLNFLAQKYAEHIGLFVPSPFLNHRPLIATGHQPELYHPGVLVKNFAVGRLAHRLDGAGFNITVDSDVAKTTGLTLPTGAGDHFEETLTFSDARPPLPYEEWRYDDETAFATLAERAREITQAWPWQPVLDAFWDQARRAHSAYKIPERWLIARHHLECKWGVVNHELPLSWICGSDLFTLLFGTFLERRGELTAVYNEELARYRREHKIRSRNHPVADLEVAGDRIELPFWAWFSGTTQRGRLFVRPAAGAGVELVVVLPGREEVIPGTWPTDAVGMNRLWMNLCITGWKIRPKALITTMMFRLFLADLFIHGIGGAVYDELTDRIFSRFFGTELPAFAVVTATLRLPWGETPVGEEDERCLRQTLRSLQWNPDRFLPTTVDGDAGRYVQLKRQLIGQPADGSALQERHRQFELVRERLRPYVAEQERQTETALHETHRRHRRDEHRFSREYAWVLYPEEDLRRLVQRFGRG